MNRAPSTQPVLSRFNPTQPGAQGMKVVATGLLVVMAAVFFGARSLEHQFPAFGYVKAFAEAAMVAGMLPIALSLTGDASWRAPMGVTVIGGLIFSTMLTLLLVPAYFSIAISIESRIGRLFHRVVGSDAHAVGHAVPAE